MPIWTMKKLATTCSNCSVMKQAITMYMTSILLKRSFPRAASWIERQTSQLHVIARRKI
jgi:hypothetical protein